MNADLSKTPALQTTHQVRPRLLRLTHPADRAESALLIANPAVEGYDTLQHQLRELVQTRSPERTLAARERAAAMLEILDGRTLAEYGVWLHYPWARRLVHLLDREEFIELRTSRNRYLVTEGEQARLAEKRVGIVGLSVGQSVALAIALERGCGELRLADHDTLDLSNLNRLRAGLHEVGLPKVVIAAREIAELDPYLEVLGFPEGLTEATLDGFFSRGGPLDLVIDECDGLAMKVRLRERARELRIPVLMQTSDRGLLDIERFDLQPDRPLFHGLAGDLRAESLAGLTSEQKVPHVLKILGVDGLSTRMRASLLEVEHTVRTWPQIGSAVTFGGGLAADTARRILLNQIHRSGRFYVDLAELVSDAIAAPAALGVSEDVLRDLVCLATLAPSGGNHQPWRWVARGHRLELHEDPAQRMALTDFENLGTAVALGAAAESLVLAAHDGGLEVATELPPPGAPGDLRAIFDLAPSTLQAREAHDFDHLGAHLEVRRTERRLGRRESLPPDAPSLLREAAESFDGVHLRLRTERAPIEALARLVGEGDRLRILDPGLSREMFAELRWTKSEATSRGDGLEVSALELSATDRAGLELARDPKALALLAEWGLGAALAQFGQKSAASSAAIGLLTVNATDRAAFFRAGRALQRLWLTATARGLGLHPMSFLPYAFARILRGGGQGLAPSTAQGLAALWPPYSQLFGLDPAEGQVLLFRLFPSTGPVTPSHRRAVDSVLQFVP